MKSFKKVTLLTLTALQAASAAVFAAPVETASDMEPTVLVQEKAVDASAEKLSLPVPTAEPAPVMVEGIASTVLPFAVEARFYAPHMDAKVSSDNIKCNGGAVGLKDTLGFGNDNAPELILKYKRLSLDYIRVHGTGTHTFSGRDVLTFSGTRYHGTVNSKSDLDYIKLNVVNPIASVGGTGFDWSYGITAMHWKGAVHGTSLSGQQASDSKSYWVPVPTIGVGAHMTLDPGETFKLFAHISGLPLGGYGHFYDLEAGLRYNPIENLGITAGYRRIDANVHHDDDSGNFCMNGPYAGLQYSF